MKSIEGQDKKEKKEKSKHTTGGDLTYCEKFDLPQTEVVIKELACWLKQVMRKLGRLYISQNYLCFESHVFGHHSKVVYSTLSLSLSLYIYIYIYHQYHVIE
jgi:hypothetical protein